MKNRIQKKDGVVMIRDDPKNKKSGPPEPVKLSEIVDKLVEMHNKAQAGHSVVNEVRAQAKRAQAAKGSLCMQSVAKAAEKVKENLMKQIARPLLPDLTSVMNNLEGKKATSLTPGDIYTDNEGIIVTNTKYGRTALNVPGVTDINAELAKEELAE